MDCSTLMLLMASKSCSTSRVAFSLNCSVVISVNEATALLDSLRSISMERRGTIKSPMPIKMSNNPMTMFSFLFMVLL